MIEKLVYTNQIGDSVEFSTNSIYHTNISIDVTGLSDVQNILFSSASMGQDGDTITGSKIQSKAITIVGAIRSINKDKIAEARRVMNRVLNPRLEGKLTYQCASTSRTIECRLESAPIFGRINGFLQFSIDIFCPLPFWKDEKETRTEIAGWIGKLEFSTAGLEIVASGSVMGERTPDAVVMIRNDGDVSTGLTVVFTASGSVVSPKITNIETAEFMYFKGLTLLDKDVLTVTTGYGQKACLLHRNGDIINALPNWDTSGKFLQLNVGENFFKFDADANKDRLEVVIRTNNQYLGV